MQRVHINMPERSLQRLAQEPNRTGVTSEQELLDAMELRASHIEVPAHLDLTTVEPRYSSMMRFSSADAALEGPDRPSGYVQIVPLRLSGVLQCIVGQLCCHGQNASGFFYLSFMVLPCKFIVIAQLHGSEGLRVHCVPFETRRPRLHFVAWLFERSRALSCSVVDHMSGMV